MFTPLAVAVALGPGCGEMPGETDETVRGELGTFSAFVSAGGILNDAPALVKGRNTTLTAFGWGTDGAIWTSAQDQNGHWTGSWTPLPGGAFASRPAVALLDIPSGPLSDHFAIAAMRSDGHYYVRVQNQTGSDVVKDWTPVSTYFNGSVQALSWTTAPAIAFVARQVATAGFDRVIIAGGTASGRLDVWNDWLIDNNVYDGEYQNLPWYQGLPPYTDTAPALSYVPVDDVQAALPYLLLAWGVEDSRGIWFRNSWLDPKNGGEWLAPVNNTNGIFSSGPAIAAGQHFTREVTIYGLGLDSRIWVTNQVNNGGFSPIGTQTFSSNVTATWLYHTVNISALINRVPFTSFAESPELN